MPTNKSLLVTLPRHDVVTMYLSAWSEEVVALARTKRIPTYALRGEKATRTQFESYVRARRPSCIFLNGHGNADMVTGHADELMVDCASPLDETIVYARSCDAGQALGPLLAKEKYVVFLGYKRKFMIGYLLKNMARPQTDPLAALFLRSSNLAPLTLLKGHTALEAHMRAKEAMYRNFRRMISSAATYEERYAARWLWGNITSQVLFGDGNRRM